jgi:FMN-dependent NADH-azoreductase
MTDLLYVQSSPRGGQSESRALAETFLAAYRAAAPDATVDHLDLWEQPLPVFAGDHVAAKMTVIGGTTPAGREATAWDAILEVAERFTDADAYLFTVPMWNHSVPWVLKHLIDTITQPGVTFGFDLESGYTGLLEGKRAAAIYTSAIWPTFGDDFHSSYFEDWLRLVGVEDIHSVRLGSDLLDPSLDLERERARREAAELGRLFASGGAARRPAPPTLLGAL